MSVSFHVKASDGATREGRLGTCARVLQSLHPFLPTVCDPTVLCLIDNVDFDWAKQQHGQANRGFFVAPVKGKGLAGSFLPISGTSSLHLIHKPSKSVIRMIR
jgi:hypothetical protein